MKILIEIDSYHYFVYYLYHHLCIKITIMIKWKIYNVMFEDCFRLTKQFLITIFFKLFYDILQNINLFENLKYF